VATLLATGRGVDKSGVEAARGALVAEKVVCRPVRRKLPDERRAIAWASASATMATAQFILRQPSAGEAGISFSR
jgi:hypothetical protein